MTINLKAPHQATILLKAEIMEKRHDGSVTGIPVDTASKVFTVTGQDFAECKTNVLEFIKRFKKHEN